jgi:uncharacterized protein (DUF885 family)
MATSIGDGRYNDRLPINISPEYKAELQSFYLKYLNALAALDTTHLNQEDTLNYELLRYLLKMGLEGLSFQDELTPVNQIQSFTLFFPILGSGQGAQPFKTVSDYKNFLSRVQRFPAWINTAIVNMRKGMASGYVLPKTLAEKVLPQLRSQVVSDPKESVFYGPVANMPATFSAEDRTALTDAYIAAIQSKIVPAYRRLYEFMQEEYLPRTRSTSGISALPNGRALYAYLVRYFTTSPLLPEQVFDIGMREVQQIRAEMEKVKKEVGFTGDLKAFFVHVQTSPDQFPFKTDEDVLNAYRAIGTKIEPHITKLFSEVPKSGFEVRQTEKFRAASASAQYFRPSADGGRPGIFYVPIVDATKYPATSIENIFLHEAIPGHHLQIALQMEQKNLPAFRRFGGYGAYTEGWGLYAESLGKELGLYTNPYAYFGRLMWNMHRALRLVVDAGLHAKGWTREQGIKFMLENNAVHEDEVTKEVERFMAMPGQALSYKMGELKLLELRKRATEKLGDRFDIRAFHGAVLKNGAMPLSILEQQIDTWIEKQREP